MDIRTKASSVRSEGRRRWRWPTVTIDLTRPQHRRNVLLAVFAFSIAGAGVLCGGPKVFHWSESSEFCIAADEQRQVPLWVGSAPESHSDFRTTVDHRTTTDAEREQCYQCHGQGFCKNEACHDLAHPPDMLYTHSDEYRRTGDQVCYNSHQAILCSQCHPGGVVASS